MTEVTLHDLMHLEVGTVSYHSARLYFTTVPVCHHYIFYVTNSHALTWLNIFFVRLSWKQNLDYHLILSTFLLLLCTTVQGRLKLIKKGYVENLRFYQTVLHTSQHLLTWACPWAFAATLHHSMNSPTQSRTPQRRIVTYCWSGVAPKQLRKLPENNQIIM